MADIQRLPSELEVGVFSDNLLSTQLDTQERVNSLFSDFNVPDIQHSVPMIPKDWNTDDILHAPNLPKREDYLTSNDPKLRELAKSAMAQDASSNRALTKKFGMPNMVRYQEGQEKFTTDHWWSESGKTKYGFNPYKSLAENDAFYHENVWNNYSLVGKAWRGIGTFAGRTLSKVVTGLVGMVGDVGSMMWNGLEEAVEAAGGPKNNFWADVSDNWLARTMEEADNYTKQQILPVYKDLNYDNKGVLSKLSDPTFWMTDISDGAGFLLQFAIPGTMFGKAAMLGKAGKLGRFGKVMAAGVGELPTASRLSKGIGTGLEFLTGSRNVGGISAHVFNTTMESVAETKEGFNNTVNDLVSKGYSRHEAEQVAAENAPQQFGLNMAILSVSNAFENKWFQQSIGNRLNPMRSSINDAGLLNTKPGNWVGKFFATTKTGNRIFHYGGNGMKAAFMEGYWEENAQLAAQRVSRGEYTRRGENTPNSGRLEKTVGFFKQLMKQTLDASKGNDREAADSIMAGVVIGVLGGAAFSKFSGTRDELRLIDGNVHSVKNLKPEDAGKGEVIKKKTFLPEGERKQRLRDNALVVAQVKNAQDAWLSISAMPDGLYKEDHTIDEEKAAVKIAEINEKLAKVGSVVHRRANLETITDPIERENLQYLLFGDYVKAHILNGTGEGLVNRLKNWGKKSKEELESYGVNTDMIEDPAHWSNVAQDMITEYENIDKIRFVNNTDETATGYAQKERAIKSVIFDYIANKQAAKTVASRYMGLQIENDPFIEIDEFNSYNKMIAWKGSLEETLKAANLDSDTSAHFKAELDKVNSQIEMRSKSLPEHEVGDTGMVFEKGSEVKAKERKIFESVNEYLGYKYGREDAQRTVEAFDTLIKKYSNPENGLKNWNDTVDFYEAQRKKIKLAKLTDLKYSKEEIAAMTPEQQDAIVAQEKVNEKAPVVPEVKPEVVEKEPTLEELKQVVFDILKQYNPSITMDGVDKGAIQFVTIMKNNPSLMDTLDDDKKAEFQIIQQYVEMKVATTKQEVTKEEAKQPSETQPVTPAAEQVVIQPIAPPNVVKSQKDKIEKINEAKDLHTQLFYDFTTINLAKKLVIESLSSSALEEEKNKWNTEDDAQKAIDDEIESVSEKIEYWVKKGLSADEIIKKIMPPLSISGNPLRFMLINGKQRIIRFIKAKTKNEINFTLNEAYKTSNAEINAKYDAELADLDKKEEPKAGNVGIGRETYLVDSMLVEKINPDGENTALTERQEGSIEKAVQMAIDAGQTAEQIAGTLNALGYAFRNPLGMQAAQQTLINYIKNRINGTDTRNINEFAKNTKAVEQSLKEQPKAAPKKSDIDAKKEAGSVGVEVRTINDFANENESYRVIVGDEAFNDIVESGTVRTNAGNKGGESLSDKLKNRPTLFPSFSKGKASMEYAAENPNNYIIVTEDASIQPSKAGRHGKGTTMFPTDENGNHLKELSGEKVKVYKHIGEGQYVLVYANGKVVEQSLKEQPKASVYDASKNVEITWTSGVNSSGKIAPSMLSKDKGENTSWRIAQTPSNQFVIDQISPKNENAIATRHESLVRPLFEELNLPEKGNNKAIIIKPAIIEYDRQTGEGRLIEKGTIAWNKIPEYSTAKVVEEVKPTRTEPTLVDLVREAYRLHEQAIENDTTFKEEAEKENMKIHNNKMDDHVDSGKTTGNITLITSNPNDLKNNRLNDDNNNVSRFNLLDNLLTGKLDKNNFKMTLGLSEKGNIFGIVADIQDMPVKFDDKGMPHSDGLPILFYLDYDMFTTQNINKRRSDVVAPPFKLAPLATSPGVAGQNEHISFSPPLELHRSFVDRDVIEMIKDRIRRTTVTASIDFVTQGLLFREGTTNSYAAIPKNAAIHTASDLFEKGHIRDEKGEIHLDDIFLSGVYRRAHRIQFAMYKNINKPSDGAEIAEFRPLALKDVTNEEGKKIVDILKAENGQNFFEAAVTGNLESTKENLTTLTSLLRPDKFLILNLGTNILVVSAKRFKNLMKSDNITVEKLRAATKVEDLLNVEINMTKTFYDNSDEVELLPGILGEGRNNYSRFINRNVVTSTKPLTKTSEIEGYARINKRIALTLDENMDDMIKAVNQKEQENKAPEITEVAVLTETELSESEKKSAVFTPINPDVEENLDEDFTNTDC